jgi:hypothetical protein
VGHMTGSDLGFGILNEEKIWAVLGKELGIR